MKNKQNLFLSQKKILKEAGCKDYNESIKLLFSKAFKLPLNSSYKFSDYVGSNENSNYNGLFDIAGNVREWIVNSLSDDSSIKGILGGSFNDEPYYFNDYFVFYK